MILHCGVTIQLHVLESSGPATTNVLSHFWDTVELSQVDSAFYPLWDGKMSTSQRKVMFCGGGVKAGMV